MKVSFRVNGKDVAIFPMFVKKLGNSYLMRFKAMEYDTERKTIYPIYKQAFDVVPKAGELLVSIFIGEFVLDLFFFKRAPFVNIGYSKSRIEIGGDECE